MPENDIAASFATQLRKGLLTYCVLQLCDKEPIYSSDILENLKKAELIVAEGTLYPLLSRLTRESLLKYSWQESPSGPPRKYFELTPAGKKHLAELKKAWKEITQNVTTLEKQN